MARGSRHWGQKRAVARTDAPQRGQVPPPFGGAREGAETAEVTVTGLPHCLQKRAPGRSAAPQWGHVGVAAGGSAHRHFRQKCASGRLLVPHCGQTFTARHPRAAAVCRQQCGLSPYHTSTLIRAPPFARQGPSLCENWCPITGPGGCLRNHSTGCGQFSVAWPIVPPGNLTCHQI
jgi:hypothetical protein